MSQMAMGMEAKCHRSITEHDAYPESGRQSGGWSAFDISNKQDSLQVFQTLITVLGCCHRSIVYNHGILACLKWSHTKNPCTTIYKIWALTNKFWGEKNFYGDKDKFSDNKKLFLGWYKIFYGQPKKSAGSN